MKQQKKLSNSELSSFCTELSLLYNAGITPDRGISIMIKDSKNPKGTALLKEIQSVTGLGGRFHEALEKTGVFPEYVTKTVALGEESGNLEECLSSLASYYEKEEHIADSIKDAITYPLIMLLMMFIVIFVLISRVMPIFNQVYSELGAELSGFARTLMGLGDSLNRYSIIFTVILLVLIALYFLATKTHAGRNITTSFLRDFPLTKGFYRDVAAGRFAAGLSLCIKSGMDTYASLDMVDALVGDPMTSEQIEVCRDKLRHGSNLSEAISTSQIFSNLFSQMISVGSKTGNVDLVLIKIAERYEESSDKKIRRIISVLEPTLVIILSIVVGLILLSVIMPLMGIMSSIG